MTEMADARNGQEGQQRELSQGYCRNNPKVVDIRNDYKRWQKSCMTVDKKGRSGYNTFTKRSLYPPPPNLLTSAVT